MPSLVELMTGIPEDEPAGRGKGIAKPSFVKRHKVNVDTWFDVDGLWKEVQKAVGKAYSFGKIEIPVLQITHPGVTTEEAAYETAAFFGKEGDISRFDAQDAWNRMLIPFLDAVEETLNEKKPKELGGKLRFDVAEDQSLTLFYIDK